MLLLLAMYASNSKNIIFLTENAAVGRAPVRGVPRVVPVLRGPAAAAVVGRRPGCREGRIQGTRQ